MDAPVSLTDQEDPTMTTLTTTTTTSPTRNKEPTPSAAPMVAWVGIVRDETLLVQFPGSHADQSLRHSHDPLVAETARGLLNREPSHGWDTYSTVPLWRQAHRDATALRGLRFPVLQPQSSDPQAGSWATYVYACVYDSARLTKLQAQSFLEKIVCITEVFRETDPTWQNSPTFEACQAEVCPMLEQRVQELHRDARLALTDDRLEYCHTLTQRNRQWMRIQKQQERLLRLPHNTHHRNSSTQDSNTLSSSSQPHESVAELWSRSVGNLSSMFQTSPASGQAETLTEVRQRPKTNATNDEWANLQLPDLSDQQETPRAPSHELTPTMRNKTDCWEDGSENSLSPKDIIEQCQEEHAKESHTATTQGMGELTMPGESFHASSSHSVAANLSGLRKLLFSHRDQHNDMSAEPIDVSHSQEEPATVPTERPKQVEAATGEEPQPEGSQSPGGRSPVPGLMGPIAPRITGILKRIGKEDTPAKPESGRRRAFNKFQPKVASEEFKVLEIAAKKELSLKAEVPFESEKLGLIQEERAPGTPEPTKELFGESAVPLGQTGYAISASMTDAGNDGGATSPTGNGIVSSMDGLIKESPTMETATTLDSDVSSEGRASEQKEVEVNHRSLSTGTVQSVFRKKRAATTSSIEKKLVDLSTGAEKVTMSRQSIGFIQKSYSDLSQCYDYLKTRSFSGLLDQNDRFVKVTTMAVIGAAVIFSRWPRGSTSTK